MIVLECCNVCDEPTGNSGRGDGSVFVERNGKEIGPLCGTCSDDFSCSQCGEIAISLHEGYCEKCCNQNQTELNEYNFQYDRWTSLDDDKRNEEIRRACC